MAQLPSKREKCYDYPMKKLCESVDKFGLPLQEEPKQSLGDVRRFWEENNSFYEVAFHLVKIFLFPGHQASTQWKISVSKQLNFILRSTCDSLDRPTGMFLRRWRKNVDQLQKRIDQEFVLAANNVWDAMAADREYAVNVEQLDAAKSIKDLGFEVVEYQHKKFGISLEVRQNGKKIIDSVKP